MDWDWNAIFRIANVVLSISALGMLGANMMARRPCITRRSRRTAIWLYAMLLVLAYTSGDGLHDHRPLHEGIIMLTLCLIGLLVSLIWNPEGDDKYPPDDGSWGQWLLDRLARLRERMRA